MSQVVLVNLDDLKTCVIYDTVKLQSMEDGRYGESFSLNKKDFCPQGLYCSPCCGSNHFAPIRH